MNQRVFVCTASDPFDLFGLREALQRELMSDEQSCRWCGCRDDEVVTVRGA